MAAGAICPYPGLRPFTVEESIYFKGRDTHIETIIKLLEERKFLMLTGASGDGKSSLVYAGVIPNARAGFFKAQFNNWRFVDFTPSRTPMDNLASAVAEKLEMDQAEVKTELGYGFSALVDLYTKSKFYQDEASDEFLKAKDDEKKARKKQAGNLFILVDQFEEFYTNPENYVNGKPSLEAVTVINLLLETAKIAHERKLPIYIIFTMRSDYIGHCAAFRGLPEYIGFSQFFVPRLKRKEVYQVIAEPAMLSGVSISQRLTETLINELSEGFDQLPVLQHALNQVFQVAEEGEEMDLIHLAKLSGMPPADLPAESKEDFDGWFQSLPEFKKGYFQHPSLANVLNLHANELYETAFDHYKEESGSSISEERAEQILKRVFQCLTKTDENRAVRNRMTLGEITDIIDDANIKPSDVTSVVNMFREQGNTFIRPFITDDPASRELSGDEVLDITHEALIRNWDLLKDWAEEEYENYLNYQDFKKQLDRWIENDRSAGYLLPVGPLNYFQAWFDRAQPNANWLAKYDERSVPTAEKIADSEAVLTSIVDFLKRSTRAIEEIERSKKRKRNMALVAAAIIIIILSGISFWAINQKALADEQRKLAEASKTEAQEAQGAAEDAKDRAEASAAQALLEKERADSLFLGAISAKNEADRERLMATRQRYIAEAEKKRAEEQTELAQSEKDKAKAEKERAEGAEQSARQLSLLALAQSLALKASAYDQDKELKSLMAAQAYIFHRDNQGNSSDAVIYDAVLSAMSAKVSADHNALKGSRTEPRSIIISGTGKRLTAVGKDGRTISWDIGGKSRSGGIEFGSGYTKSPINFVSQSGDGRAVLSAHDNYIVNYWDLSSGAATRKELKGHKSYVRAVAFSGTKVATAGKDKVIIVWDVSGDKVSEVSRVTVPSAVVGMEWVGGTIYYILEDKTLNSLSVSGGTTKVIATGPSKPRVIEYNSARNRILVGFTNGALRVYNPSSGKYSQIKDHTASVDQIAIGPKGRLLATASPDNSIKIYDLDNLKWNPISITEHKSKVRCLVFDRQGKIYAGCSNNKIVYFDSDPKPIFNKLANTAKRNMTKAEWAKHIGSEVDYTKTFVDLR